MKTLAFTFFLILSTSNIFADVTNLCRWTSERECKEKEIGSSCKKNGKCMVLDWKFSEPECSCYEKPDEKKSYCSSSSDSQCRNMLAGSSTRDGVCKIDRVSFEEPVCKFIKNKK